MDNQYEKNKVREKLGIPKVETQPSKKDLEVINAVQATVDSKEKPTAIDSIVKREALIAKVEQYMSHGSDNAFKIGKSVGIDKRTCATYMEAVRARWAMAGSRRSLQQAKGAGLSRLAKIKQELWDIMEGRSTAVYKKGKGKKEVIAKWKPQDVDPDTKIKALKTLLDCHEKELYLDGCSADMLQELPSSFDSGSGKLSVAERKLEATRQKELVTKYLQFLKDSSEPETIDINPE